jgi:signal transduction histidine kinase/CheY-like chemotaxis protein
VYQFAHRLVLRYGLAVFVAGIVTWWRVALESAAGGLPTLLLAATAILLVSWLGAVGPGLLATGLIGLVCYPVVPPVTLTLFLVHALAINLLVAARSGERRQRETALASLSRQAEEARQSERRILDLNRDLQRRLDERNSLALREQAQRLAAERRHRNARLLADVARSVNDSLDLDQMLPPVAAAACELSESDSARLALRHSESEGLTFRHCWGTRFAGYGEICLEPDQGVTGKVIATGQSYRVDDVPGAFGVGGDPLWPSAEEEPGAAIVVPIRIGHRVEGLLCADRRSPRAFADEDEGNLLRLADLIGIALRNLRLLAGEQSARAEAEAASRAKDEFLAMLGHELRNPLGAISNATRVLHQIGDQATRLQDIIGRQTHHLARLLDDLLDVSRMTSGKILLHRQAVDLRETVAHSLAALEHEGKTGRHDVQVDTESAVVDGDPTRLEQVVRNLLDNALKYTPAGGRVTVSVRREGDEAVLRVSDTGAGIAPDVLPRVFDLFVQAERSLDRSMGGLGLGLTLVRRLVELHGGSVAAASPGPERGSEFLVRLPHWLEALPPAPTPELATNASRSRRVLVIEDNRDAREGLRMLLETWGHRVEEASDGQRGLELALASRPEVALIDVGLPGLDGYAVARGIQAAPGGQVVLLVAVTGYGQPEDAERSREAGFHAHMVKPIDPDELATILTRGRPQAR